MQPILWVLLGGRQVWSLEASSASRLPVSLALIPFTSASQYSTPEVGTEVAGPLATEAAHQEKLGVCGLEQCHFGISYLSPHTSPYLMSVITQTTPSKDHDEGVATSPSVLGASEVGQGQGC